VDQPGVLGGRNSVQRSDGFGRRQLPAFYLSSFQPIKVLKGTYRVGRFAAIPRKVLVVLQFTVSIALIIGITVVFRQIQFAKSRPVGYTREGLVMIETPTPKFTSTWAPCATS
jgi:hypothetical protein